MTKALEAKLAAAGLEHGGVTVGATPRRTVVRVAQLAAAQGEQARTRARPAVARVRGRRRYTHEGCSGLLQEERRRPADLEKDGEYVWANVDTVGVSATEVLRERFPA